ncbi:hypothetical protein [Musicola keenii]|uniref:hypothetical protein n=1 Tax=Musicola keenii TaxID=2884250 RepID=UPI0038B3BDC6
MFRVVYLTVLLLPAGTFAGTVIYTDSAHPVISGSSTAQVVYLDAPDKILLDCLPIRSKQKRVPGQY